MAQNKLVQIGSRRWCCGVPLDAMVRRKECDENLICTSDAQAEFCRLESTSLAVNVDDSLPACRQRFQRHIIGWREVCKAIPKNSTRGSNVRQNTRVRVGGRFDMEDIAVGSVTHHSFGPQRCRGQCKASTCRFGAWHRWAAFSHILWIANCYKTLSRHKPICVCSHL